MRIAGVRFKDNWKIYDFDASDVEVAVNDAVIVDSERGQGFARVVRVREAEAMPVVEQAEEKKKPVPEEEEEIEIDIDDAYAETPPPAKKTAKGHRRILRKANADDLAREEKNREREKEAFTLCQSMVAERELPMRLVRAEYSYDGSRATFFFFSETRVDFRDLVKDLAHRLRARIEMRQIGVRDVARLIGGFGPCGRELCCVSFLKGFEPVSIRMAKKQEMVLNPAKISGVCGRLLCCLSYEYGMYDEIKKDIADMKATEARSKREAEEQRIAETRRDEEERRREEDQQRKETDQRKQEQRQRDRDRQKDQKPAQKQEKGQKQGQKQEKKRDGRPDQRQQPKPQQPRQQQPRPQQEPQPQGEQEAQEGQAPAPTEDGQQQGEKGKSKRRRRFWRGRKKGGGGQPQGGAPQGSGGAPAGGGAQ